MTYTAGIIGTGGVAGMGILGVQDADEIGNTKVDSSHAGGYAAADDVDLRAIADIDAEKLARFGDVWDIDSTGRYRDHREMLAAEDLDIVSVCTPTYLHHEHVIDAAEAASPPDVIWCEKPLASGVRHGERMVEACADNDTELLVNHTSRFSQAVNEVRTHIRDDEVLGDVKSAYGQFRMELMRNSTHLLDTLVYLLEAEPERVTGYINGINEASEELDVDRSVDDAGGGGTVVTTDGTFMAVDCTVRRAYSTMSYQFTGTKGRMTFNPMDEECRFWSLEDGTHHEQELPVTFAENSYQNSFARAVDHAVDLIEGNDENRSSGREALQSLRMIAGFYISHYTGSHVQLPLDRPLKDVSITSW